MQNPDQLVARGHAPTRKLAEAKAQKELEDLSFGQAQGENVTSSITPLTYEMGQRH